MTSPEGYEYITGEVRIVSDFAISFYDGARTEWIPKSLVEDPAEFEIGKTIELLIPEWLAIEKGFI